MRNIEPEVSHGLIPATVLIFSHKKWETSNQKSITSWFEQLCWYLATRDEKLRTRSQSRPDSSNRADIQPQEMRNFEPEVSHGLITATVLIFSHKKWETSNQKSVTAWFQQLCWYSATRDEKLRTRSQSRPDSSNCADIQPQEMRNFEPEVSQAWFQQLCWYSATRDEKLRTKQQSESWHSLQSSTPQIQDTLVY